MPRKSQRLLIATESKLDKYRAHLLDGELLNDAESEMLERYRKAWAWLSMMYSRNQVVTLIEKEYDISNSQAYTIVRECLQLYGDVIENDRKGMKHIMYENFMLAAGLARKNGDHNAMIRAMENAAKIKGVFSEDESTIDPNAFLVPVPILFTSDPQVLKQQIIDIEHEEQPNAREIE